MELPRLIKRAKKIHSLAGTELEKFQKGMGRKKQQKIDQRTHTTMPYSAAQIYM